ncbi:ubiquitin-specific protease ubp2 [Friedmanniomyces endolithicus]|nr:ubiquitin-specific protease ubp2 [Friedmanniomyces endolithicus]
MSSPPYGPGKTAPKLCDDFLDFDPSNAARSANLLADHSPLVGEGQHLSYKIGSCRHDYTTKHSQSVTPPLDFRPDGTTRYKLAAVCKKCRLHAAVSIDYRRATNPCPNGEYPLHHFQRLPDEDVTSQTQILYAWQCSAPQCQAHLQIAYRQPRLSDADRDLLTNTDRLKRRYEAAVQEDPNRDGMRQATPIDALGRLRKYIKDSLNPAHNRRTFPAANKRFMEAFGVQRHDCMELLQRLGFQYDETAEQEEWSLPNPAPVDFRLQADGNSPREVLEDVGFELVALMSKVASETGAINSAASEGWPSAVRDVERTLAAQGYQRYAPLRRAPASNDLLAYVQFSATSLHQQSSLTTHRYFASLGVLQDFADTLIEFAFDRQSNCDPERQAYYFECLQVIAESRGTEQLQTRVAMLESQDLVSRRDLSAAFRYLGVQVPTVGSTPPSVEYILDCFTARQSSVSPAVAEKNREALLKIGIARSSQKLIKASRQSVDTYEDALAWLGPEATKDTPDDLLLALAATRNESAADKEIVAKAIGTIARERKSNALNNWLLTGNSAGYEMSVDEALRYIGVEQKLEELDTAVLTMQFDGARADKPGEQTEKAIRTIQKALASPSHSPESWPVGLISHGNTCYLNSLLQYYFGIKPFRDIILDYDQYKLDLHETKEKKHCVGGRHISAIEIKSGQRFARDLKELFQHMITARGPAVKPETDLVCRAFLDPERYGQLASDVIGDDNAVNGVEDYVDIKLPDLPATEMQTPSGDATDGKERRVSNASSVTLQEDEDTPMLSNGESPPTPPESPAQKPGQEKEQPNYAPPLPPRIRRFSTNEEKEAAQRRALEEAREKAKQQQDVTEVHDSATWRLRAGMRAQGVDDGTQEQVDALRSLYTVAVTDTVIKDDGALEKPTLLKDPGIQLNVPTEDTDIYAALDEVFDLQPSDVKFGQESYKSIRTLPPILQINISRIAYENGQTHKYTKTVRLEDELYLDRYLDTPDILPSRRACWELRRRLRNLRRERKVLKDTDASLDLEGPAVVSEAAEFLEGLFDMNAQLAEVGVDPLELDTDLSSDLKSAAEQHKQRLVDLEREIDGQQNELEQRVKTHFSNLRTAKYRLAAVFFHRGTTTGGHYWLDIHDFQNNIWRRYNDETVEELPANRVHEILEAKEHNHGTPTYVVYVDDSRKEDLVQPVCRDPEDAPPEEPAEHQWQDVQMSEQRDVRALPPPPAAGTIDPKMLEEGGEASWDTPRQVGAAVW